MDEKQYRTFGSIAQQCESTQYNSINVASRVRSDAIVAAWRELENLREALRPFCIYDVESKIDGQYITVRVQPHQLSHARKVLRVSGGNGSY